MPRTPRRSAQRLLHLAVIASLVLSALGPVSPPRTLAAAPERRYVLPAFDLQAELAGLPPEAPPEATARAASALPEPEVPPEPQPEAPDVVPAILLATVAPPLAKAGELVTVTVVVSAEGDLPAGTLGSDLPEGVTFASTLGERALVLAAERELQHPLSTVACDLTCGNQLTATEVLSGAVYRRTVTEYYLSSTGTRGNRMHRMNRMVTVSSCLSCPSRFREIGVTYSYDAAGNIKRIQLTQPTPTEDVTFQYDAQPSAFGRRSVQRVDAVRRDRQHHQQDGVGLRLSRLRPGQRPPARRHGRGQQQLRV